MTLASCGLTLLSVPYWRVEGLRRWRQLGRVEFAMRYKGGISIVCDVHVPPVLEELVEAAKFIQYGQLMDLSTSQVNFDSIILITEPFCESMVDTGPNAD